MTITLTPQQQEGLDRVAAWYPMSGQATFSEPFRWFGYAGTGKTFTAARIPEMLGLNNVVYGTYTGKAFAGLLADGCARALPGPQANPAGADSTACAAALGYTPQGQLGMLSVLAKLMLRPPFTGQSTFSADQARMKGEIELASAKAST